MRPRRCVGYFVALCYLKADGETVGIGTVQFSVRASGDFSIVRQLGSNCLEIALRSDSPNHFADCRSTFDRRGQTRIIRQSQMDRRPFLRQIRRTHLPILGFAKAKLLEKTAAAAEIQHAVRYGLDTN